MSRLRDAMDGLPNVLTAAQLGALGSIRRKSRRRGMAEEYVGDLLNGRRMAYESKRRRKGGKARAKGCDHVQGE